MNENILIIGKFPPIQGGVSKLTYNVAKELASNGYIVTVLTNAEEADPHYKVNLLEEDYQFMNDSHPNGGKLTVVNLSDKFFHYTPYSKSFETRLFGKGATLIEQHRPDVIIGWYYQPYGFVAGLLAKFYNIKCIVIHAGSDIGRLSKHPDFGKAYQKMFDTVDFVITEKIEEMQTQLKKMGVDSNKIRFNTGLWDMHKYIAPKSSTRLENYFALFKKWIESLPINEELKEQVVNRFRNQSLNPKLPTIGIYGKVGNAKGTYELMEALNGLQKVTQFNFICIPLGVTLQLNQFFNQLLSFDGLSEVTNLLPPIPYWHIPNFINSCDIVCFLENGFDIAHTPSIPFEILRNEAALYVSNEVINNANLSDVLVDDLNCITVANVGDIEAHIIKLKKYLEAPALLKNIAKRGKKTVLAFDEIMDKQPTFSQAIEEMINI